MPSRPGISMSSSATSARCGAGRLEHVVAAARPRRRPRCRPRARAGWRARRAPSPGPRRSGRGSCRSQGQREPQPEAAAGPRARLERAVEPACPLGEAGQAGAVAVAVRAPRAVVVDLERRPPSASVVSVIAQARAPLWRTTFVVASRTAQASTLSTSAGSSARRGVDPAVDAGGRERHARAVERVGERELGGSRGPPRAPRSAPAGSRAARRSAPPARGRGRARRASPPARS